MKNHGYFHVSAPGGEYGLVGSENGAMRVFPPEAPGGAWRFEQIWDGPTSDLAACDIDGDGEDELLAIQPFHGDRIALYKRANGAWREIWRYNLPVAFGHVAWGGKLRGEPAFLFGYRKEAAELAMLQKSVEGYEVTGGIL